MTDSFYLRLLALLPACFRARYGEHMLGCFRDQLRFAAGPGARFVVWSRALRDIAVTSARLRRDRFRRHLAPLDDRHSPLFPEPRGNRMDNLLQDCRYGLRQLLRTPTSTAVAIVTLALGIGANTLMFSLVNSVLLKPLPLHDPDRLVHVWSSNLSRGWPRFTVSPPDYRDFRDQGGKVFDGVTAMYSSTLTLTGQGDPVRVPGARVGDDFFQTVGIEPLLGRAFAADEHLAGANLVAVIRHDLWVTTFGADADAIGRKIVLNGQPHTLVGVLPAGAGEPATAQLWVPMDFDDEAPNRGAHYFRVIGRMRRGVDLSQADAEVRAIADRLPPAESGWSALAASFHEDKVSYARPSLYILSGAVGLVLLVACANVANLLLVRASTRRRELSLRTAIGATRGRLVRQLLVESVLLAFVGGAAGLLVAGGGLRIVRSFGAAWLPRTGELGIDPTVLLFTAAASLAAGMVFGLLPAFRGSDSSPAESLRDASVGGSATQARLRALIVVAEVAVAVVVVIGAGLMVRSLWRLQAVDPGFQTDRRVIARVSLPSADYPEPASQIAFYDRAVELIGSKPQVRAVATASSIPMGDGFSISFDIVGEPEPDQSKSAELRIIDEGYFRTLGIAVLSGRDFHRDDDASTPDVVIVNQRFVDQFFPTDEPVGQLLDIGYGRTEGSRPRRIVGVVGNARDFGLVAEPPATYFVPRRQEPENAFDILVHVTGTPADGVAAIRSAIAELDSNLPLYNVATLAQRVAGTTAPQRFRLGLIAAFAAVALSLASVGIYGMLAYTVSSQAREIGIRLAIGAAPADVRLQVLLRGLRLALVGLILGIIGGLASGRVLKSTLFEVAPHDPLTLAAVAVFLMLVAAAACYVPARRATRVDPVESLRAD